MRVFETFFPAGVVRTGAGFSGAGWVLGGERHCVPGVPTLDPRLNSPGIRMTSSKKARQESKAAPRLPISAADKFGALRFLNP